MIPAGLRRMLTFRNRRTKAWAQTGMMTTHRKAPSPPQGQVTEESLAVDDAENPLQLLARASDLHVSPQSGNGPAPSPDSVIRPSSNIHELDNSLIEVEKFFRSGQFNLDAGPELDPIDLGLVTEDEAESLSHCMLCCVWRLFRALPFIPVFRLPELPGSQDADQFRLSASIRSSHIPDGAWTPCCIVHPSPAPGPPFSSPPSWPRQPVYAVCELLFSKRLSNHCRHLVTRIIANRFRSVEIVLAFMVNVPWMFPGEAQRR